jgi:hypothetical protein
MGVFERSTIHRGIQNLVKEVDEDIKNSRLKIM